MGKDIEISCRKFTSSNNQSLVPFLAFLLRQGFGGQVGSLHPNAAKFKIIVRAALQTFGKRCEQFQKLRVNEKFKVYSSI